ncbi:hypothetical protein [Acinetobacter bouvetii]|uniref:Uncharacterized protein n=1 Tax=Acinetobacter bouvetii TaxID=202951 RepID=A0A811GJ64_9GAMM|nr:hypothetical protein [Acinetobacter bouvetii]CAB1223221.1 hypothetical protein SFB21_3243 [Acinetobacter bouvetii]
MSDSFCKPYLNPRTGNMTFGSAARNGRLKTLGGVDGVVKKTRDFLLNEADKTQKKTK